MFLFIQKQNRHSQKTDSPKDFFINYVRTPLHQSILSALLIFADAVSASLLRKYNQPKQNVFLNHLALIYNL